MLVHFGNLNPEALVYIIRMGFRVGNIRKIAHFRTRLIFSILLESTLLLVGDDSAGEAVYKCISTKLSMFCDFLLGSSDLSA